MHTVIGTTQDESNAKPTAFAAARQTNNGFILLSQTRHGISANVTILGCTLRSALDPDCLDILSWCLNNFQCIHSLDHTKYDLRRDDLKWLNTTVQDIRRTEPGLVVIFTHHAPTVEGTAHPKYIGGLKNSAFATELTLEPCWGSRECMGIWAYALDV